VLKQISGFCEQEYFELKKGSRLGVIGSIKSHLGKNSGKRWWQEMVSFALLEFSLIFPEKHTK